MFDRVHLLFLFPGLEVRGVAVSEIRCCLSLFLRPHAFANRLCCESRAHPGGADATLRGKPGEKGNQLEEGSLREDLVADMEILAWVVGLHQSAIWGRTNKGAM